MDPSWKSREGEEWEELGDSAPLLDSLQLSTESTTTKEIATTAESRVDVSGEVAPVVIELSETASWCSGPYSVFLWVHECAKLSMSACFVRFGFWKNVLLGQDTVDLPG